MEGGVSGVLLTAQSAPTSNRCQAMTITNFFAFTGSMEPLAISYIHVISQSKDNEVHTVQK